MDTRKRFIVRVSRREFVLRYADSEKNAAIDTVWNLDLEDRKEVRLQCYEYTPDIDSGLPDWEGPMFSHDHTNPPFTPNWVIRQLDAERLKKEVPCCPS